MGFLHGAPTRRRSSMRRAVRHPYVVVGSTALAARVLTALVSLRVNVPVLIPDESLYLSMASWLASGRHVGEWAPDYGGFFFRTTAAFTAPLTVLFDVFGTHRALGQALAGVYAVGATLLTLATARRVIVRPAMALIAGLLCALLPSQVLFSSVSLRESGTWLALAAIGLGFAISLDARRSRLLIGGALAAVGLLLLAYLRDLTLVGAAWALVASVALAGRVGRRQRLVGAVVLALVIPIVGGVGVGGYSYARQRDSLGTTRTVLALEANSGFDPVRRVDSGDRASAPLGEVLAERGHERVVAGYNGEAYEVDESLAANLQAIPRGAVAFLLRPFPWEAGRSGMALQLAAIESVLWYVIYVLALVGVSQVRRLRALLFPVTSIIVLVGLASVSQGNFGTAFRHRQQLVWALSLLAAVGVEVLVRRRDSVRAAREGKRHDLAIPPGGGA